VYRSLHVLGAGMGNGFMTCKTTKPRISSAGNRTQCLLFSYFSASLSCLFFLLSCSNRSIGRVYYYSYLQPSSVPCLSLSTSEHNKPRNLPLLTSPPPSHQILPSQRYVPSIHSPIIDIILLNPPTPFPSSPGFHCCSLPRVGSLFVVFVEDF
jgi:hypothetical protein